MRALVALCLSIAALACSLRAQEPVPGPKPVEASDAARTEALRRAFVDPDGNRRVALAAAASAVHRQGSAGRAHFLAALRAVRGVTADAAAADGSTPVVFAEAVAARMLEVVKGPPEASAEALAQLVADRDAGPAALQRLRERGALVFSRCIGTFVQEKLATNAIYKGQFDELRDYMPEAAPLLLEWAARPTKDVPATSGFRAACLRALRDVLPGDAGTEAIRGELHGILTKAAGAGEELLAVTAACALHQYGDPAPFERLKAAVVGPAGDAASADHLSALNRLAELHYQLGDFAVAADWYAKLLDASAKAGQPNERLTTLTYNLACSLALAGKHDEAFANLDQALTLAARDRLLPKPLLDEDHDINSLRADPRFAELIRKHFGTAERQSR